MQLMNKNLISYPIVSFFTTVNPYLDCSIKFGGWDESAIAKGDALKTVNTRSVDSWKIALNTAVVGERRINLSDKERSVIIEPQLPYMYLPTSDFKEWTRILAEIYPNVVCNTNIQGACSFKKACSSVEDHGYGIKLMIGPSDAEYEVDIPLRDLMITGNLVGASDDSCYIPIFQSVNTEDDVWYLGNLFMNNYYVVYDQSPALGDHPQDHLRVGLAKQTTEQLSYE